MKKHNDEVLKMPSNYIVVSEEEMTYLDGGLNLSYRWSYQTKLGASIKAASLKAAYNWRNISAYDLAAEIFTHAFAYYKFGVFLKIASNLGYAKGIAASILGGIDVENKLDTATIGGIRRYHLYRLVYNACMF